MRIHFQGLLFLTGTADGGGGGGVELVVGAMRLLQMSGISSAI
jgi:hypothetical protein